MKEICLAAATTSVAVSAEAGNQENPDNPLTSAVAAEQIVSATTVVVATATASVISAAIATAEEEQQDNPNPASASTSVVVLGTYAPAGIITSTVSSSQITHCIASKGLLFMVYCMQ